MTGKKNSKYDRSRISVSVSDLIYEWAKELSDKKGFNKNMSAYISDLIRRDKERDEERQMIELKLKEADAP